MQKKHFSRSIIITIVCMIILLAAAPAAAEVYINDTSGTPYSTIKEAINAAQEGDTILVSPGTYNEYGIEINKENITLKSTDGAAATIIDSRVPGSSTDCLRFFASSFSVEGFTLISNHDCIYSGSALNNGKITIKDNIIRGYDDGVTSTGHGIHLLVTSTAAAVDTDIEITGNDIVVSGQYNAAICLEMSLVRSRVEISDNNISDSFRGIFLRCELGFPGSGDPEGAKPGYASEVVIENNTIEKISATSSTQLRDGAIVVMEVYYGSVHITGNELVDCCRGIIVGNCGGAGAETDVQILNNEITLSESPPDWAYETAIHLSDPERVFHIEGNTIKGQPGYYYDDGIYLGDMGYYVEKFEGYVLNNEVSYCNKGLTNDDFCLKDGEGSLYVNGNVFTDNDSGIHFEEVDYGGEPCYFMGYLETKNNVFKNNRNGIVLPVFDYGLSPVSVLVEANLFEGNVSGLFLEDKTLLDDSAVLIRDNYFKDNSECGIDCMEATPGTKIYSNAFTGNECGIDCSEDALGVKIYLNAFTGNEYGLSYMGEEILDARFNWWGSPAGLTVEIYDEFSFFSLAENGDIATGDIVLMAYDVVDYDPWLAALDLSPAAATAAVNSIHTLTAALRDNEGDLVNLAGLPLAISVAGAHNLDGYESLVEGTVDWGYEGTVLGQDTVTAAVLFAGQGAGLEGEATVTWVSPPAVDEGEEEEEENGYEDEEEDEAKVEDKEPPKAQLPRTGGASSRLLLCSAMLLAGFCLVLKKHSGTVNN
jgi:nitrous oxidase accessory protein NosD